MAHYEIDPTFGFPVTNHSVEIAELRWRAERPGIDELEAAALKAAADLLYCHDETGISLDAWDGPAALVNLLLGQRFLPNHV